MEILIGRRETLQMVSIAFCCAIEGEQMCTALSDFAGMLDQREQAVIDYGLAPGVRKQLAFQRSAGVDTEGASCASYLHQLDR